jgi:hypothetical protein
MPAISDRRVDSLLPLVVFGAGMKIALGWTNQPAYDFTGDPEHTILLTTKPSLNSTLLMIFEACIYEKLTRRGHVTSEI